MKRKTVQILAILFLVILPLKIHAADSTASKSVIKGMKISFVFMDDFLKLFADGAGTGMIDWLDGAGTPLGGAIEFHLGGESRDLRFPVGYQYLGCKNEGKDSLTYFKVARHLFYGGALLYLTEFKEKAIVPYVSACGGYGIYTGKLSANIPDLGPVAAGGDFDGFEYLLSGGLIYCMTKSGGISFDAYYDMDLSLSVSIIVKI